MARVYNFSPGPSTIPEKVLQHAASELLEYGSSGQSVMEMSHRSSEYQAIFNETESLLREVMGIPENYRVLFIQGGATMQFSMIPLNLMNGSGKADYIISGLFAKKAWQEAKRFGDARAVASSEDCTFTRIPDFDASSFSADADYVHICQNNTIYGTRFTNLPEIKAPLAADMSSCILSEPFDVSKYGLIYAGAQKNMGPAGLCVVIVREDLIGHARENTPILLDYKTYADNDSMYNTPPTFPIYMLGLVLKWIRDDFGGLEKMKEFNEKKAAVLYDYLDNSKLFRPVAEKEYRSLMNVTFVTGDADKDKLFCQQAQKAGLYNLKGHRSVGGMRASIYNAMPMSGVEALVAFMKEFEAQNS